MEGRFSKFIANKFIEPSFEEGSGKAALQIMLYNIIWKKKSNACLPSPKKCLLLLVLQGTKHSRCVRRGMARRYIYASKKHLSALRQESYHPILLIN